MKHLPSFLLHVAILLIGNGGMLSAADVPGSKDPAGLKRYEGSEIIGYRAPKFDEFVLPLGKPTDFGANPKYEKSEAISGKVSRLTYLAPTGRTPAEVLRNYQIEFGKMKAETVFEKKQGEQGWFGPTFDKNADEDKLGQMLAYNEGEERVLITKTPGASPTYYVLFVTAYKDGIIPNRLEGKVAKEQVLVHLQVIAPDVMEEKMVFVNADAMNQSIESSGRVVLYGLLFETDKDVMQASSQPTLDEIVKLMKANPNLSVHVVGHTDNEGKPEYNLGLSQRRSASIVRALTQAGIAPARLTSFGCGAYSPVDTNDSAEGRQKNRRVELVKR
ncbi:MAG TPA: OmpA family protein [Candidatus Saccharimonadia bacterium]|nr:OmpA family protein [Candidatus Saccharimonadia bacterium]